MNAIRPWGPFDWVLDRLPNRRWSVIGCLGPEERSLAVWTVISSRQLQAQSSLIEIAAPVSRFDVLHAQRILERKAQLQQLAQPSEGILGSNLFASDSEIVTLASELVSRTGDSIILDISSFPKRFFFAFVKRLLNDSRVASLLATYTIPERYISAALAEDHLPFAHLPLFGPSSFPERKIKAVIVGAGFMKLGLLELLEPHKQGVEIHTLLPFPPGPPAFQRNWEFIREMKTTVQGLPSPARVEAYDCSDAFDHICEFTRRGKLNCILAPYGPKSISLAMCLFAIQTGSVVYYTQPTAYNPDYSLGVRFWGNQLASYAYCLKLNGTVQYSL